MRAGLRREDAVRFSFLLATPVILAAGVLEACRICSDPLGDGIRPQVLVGSVLAGVGAYVSIRWLTRWVHTNTLSAPFRVVLPGGRRRVPGALRPSLTPPAKGYFSGVERVICPGSEPKEVRRLDPSPACLGPVVGCTVGHDGRRRAR